MDINNAFAQTLKQCRKYRDLTQEDFGDVSGRTYMSELERGIKTPTLKKVESLSKVLKLETTTLVALAYLNANPENTIQQLLKVVQEELELLTNHKK